MSVSVPFYRHNLEPEDIRELTDTLAGVFLTTGPKTKLFEEAFARYFGASHAIGTTSWTTAAFLVLKAWEIGAGDEVIVPPMTFIATANVVLHCGATPVFVDVEPETGNLDARLVEAAVTPRTKAIIPVHLYGQMADMRALQAIAQPRGIKILEDCAHCIEGTRDGYRPGQLSDAACFSFYATKNITCGEGGAVVTGDGELDGKLRRLRLHGMSLSAADRYVGTYRHWDMVELGFKANLSDIQAALLLHQLERLESVWQRKEAICRFYEERFSEAGIPFPRVLSGSRSARHLFTIWAPAEARDRMLARLQEKQIGVAVNFRAVHLLGYFRERFKYQPGMFPVAEAIDNGTITLPMYARMTDAQVEYVAKTVIASYRELSAGTPAASPPDVAPGGSSKTSEAST